MNAVAFMAQRLPADVVRRLAALRVRRFERGARAAVEPTVRDADEARTRVTARWDDDLCAFLNALTRDELEALARELAHLRTTAARSNERAASLRRVLWDIGAKLERGNADVALAIQPRPVTLGGHLVVQAPPCGLYPPSAVWPRPVPEPTLAAPPDEEPDTADELLAAADRAIGVRLGARGRDKGAWGMRASLLLGVVERGQDEPDWRGDIEVKTVPVARQANGLWRVTEDPAIAMVEEGGAAGVWGARSDAQRRGASIAKLQRTLWLARADVAADDGDATIVSWYLLDWDAHVARLAYRYLHERPKGPAGTLMRGLYLHKRFFADCGLLATLNGRPGLELPLDLPDVTDDSDEDAS